MKEVAQACGLLALQSMSSIRSIELFIVHYPRSCGASLGQAHAYSPHWWSLGTRIQAARSQILGLSSQPVRWSLVVHTPHYDFELPYILVLQLPLLVNRPCSGASTPTLGAS